jgi:hypothetical protein
VQPGVWQSQIPAEMIHAAAQPPAGGSQLVMRQPYIENPQHQAIPHPEVADGGQVAVPHSHSGIEEQHVQGHAGMQGHVLSAGQGDPYAAGVEPDFTEMQAAAAGTAPNGVGTEKDPADEKVPGMGDDTAPGKRHATHAAHVEPALTSDQVPGPV